MPTELPTEGYPTLPPENTQNLEQHFFARTPQPCVILDTKGSILVANEAYSRQFGEQVAFGDDLSQDVKQSLQRFFADLSGTPAMYMQTFPHPDGTQRRWAWEFFRSERKFFGRARPMGDLPEGGLLYNALFTSASIGIALLDPKGLFVDVNGTLTRMLGHARSDLIGGRGIDLVDPKDQVALREAESQLKRGERDRYSLDLRLRKANRRRLWVSLSVSPIDLGSNQRYFLATVENIHQRIKAEQNLQERAEELARSNAELQKFAFMASHDLQQPVRTVANFMQLFERNYADQLDRDGKDLVRFAVAGAKRMQYLIRDLLQYSRVQHTPENLETINLNEVLEEVNRNLQDVAAVRKAIVLNEYLPTIQASRTQMVQLFQNLIENAIKFGSPDRNPEIQICTSTAAKRVEISVQDNGIGIEPAYADKIFALFQRLHDSDEVTGTGIGLAVCQKIVENHGGRIWVESEPGKGATFHFTLRAKN